MAERFQYTVADKEWFKYFVESDEFSESLGIVWKYGAEGWYHFEIVHKNREIIDRFATLIKGTTTVKCRFRKEKNLTEWFCNISLNHPFLLKIKEMGWTPLIEQERMYPKGDFNHAIFIKTYILMRHEVGMMREKTKKGVINRARLRIHGSTDVLQHINQHLHEELNISLKKLQTDIKVARAKTLIYQSNTDIPIILKYIGAKSTLEKFNSFELGYVEKSE
ncbi:hypothetical protein B7492_07795 [Bacillus mycoides]|uniref:Homing endonuclease LAGLIDADG domain-containing protein n=1 Tax=Bacillus mycoides TaxID=1405 RepID=A0A1W6A5R2_BACMY|nr:MULTISPECIES: hypothetical protein [Bacillus]ARJ21148.1 hypothetical protein B7492_07795 [Bacillus mycoides]MEB9339150.1 hypothetical protein [Bacillus cereus]CCW08035.1 hypothetical protein EBGED10_47650 [Bacillus sp. GeD10]